MSSSKGFYGTEGDTSFRKRWDKDEYAKKSQEKKAEQDDSKSKLEDDDAPKKLLQGRTKAVDFDSVVGKTQVVQVTGGKQPGFHCKVCDIVMKDSVSYLDHINSRIHQSNLGMSMRVERSTVDQVKARLEKLKRKAENPEPEKEYDIVEIVGAKQKVEDEEKKEKKEKKKEKKKQKKEKEEKEEAMYMDPDIAAMMGFGGFGGGKK